MGVSPMKNQSCLEASWAGCPSRVRKSSIRSGYANLIWDLGPEGIRAGAGHVEKRSLQQVFFCALRSLWLRKYAIPLNETAPED